MANDLQGDSEWDLFEKMKHVFYLIYVLSYSAAVFITGMFIGQTLERVWSRREAKAKLEVKEAQMETSEVTHSFHSKILP